MNRQTLSLMLAAVSILLSISGCKGRTPASTDIITAFPVEYTGVVNIVTDTECDKTAQARLMVLEGQACQLDVTYPRSVKNDKGECQPTGDSLVYTVVGTYDGTDQRCTFTACGQSPLITATGEVIVYQDKTAAEGSFACYYEPDHHREIRIELTGPLMISTN